MERESVGLLMERSHPAERRSAGWLLFEWDSLGSGLEENLQAIGEVEAASAGSSGITEPDLEEAGLAAGPATGCNHPGAPGRVASRVGGLRPNRPTRLGALLPATTRRNQWLDSWHDSSRR